MTNVLDVSNATEDLAVRCPAGQTIWLREVIVDVSTPLLDHFALFETTTSDGKQVA